MEITDFKKAAHAWIMFTYNRPYDFIYQIWHKEDKYLCEHIQNKFEDLNYDVNRLYCELDKNCREKLFEFAYKKYFG